MDDSSDRDPARRSISLIPGVIYEWTADGITLAEPESTAGADPSRAVLGSLRPGAEPVAGYRLLGRIGEGCTGEVWQAAGPGGVGVALKFLEAGRRGARQEREALAAVLAVRHANLVTIFGIWDHDDWGAIGMDLADGSLLDRFEAALAAGRPGLDGAEVLDFLRQAARGIDFLNEPRHEHAGRARARLIHRDIKPQNLLIVGGSVKVGDFGLVTALPDGPDAPGGPPSDGFASLVTAYSAPEVRQGWAASQSDQYSLAATYCHLRGGRAPHQSLGSPAAVDLTMLPLAERPAVARALAAVPSDRWPSCTDFVEALAAATREPRPAPIPRPAPALSPVGAELGPFPPPGRSPAAGLLATLALGALAAAAWIWSGPATPPLPDLAARPVTAVAPPEVAEPGPEPAPPPRPAFGPVVETAALSRPEPPAPGPERAPDPDPRPGPIPGPVASLPAAAPERASADLRDEAVPRAEPGPSGAELAALVAAWAAATRDRVGAQVASTRDRIEAGARALPRPAPPAATAWAPPPAPEAEPGPAPFVGPPQPDRVAIRPPAERPASSPPPRTATVVVQMPGVRAELVVRGPVGRGNPDEWYGTRRVIHSPPIAEPQDYLVGAFWFDPAGRPLVRSQPLKVEPGRSYEVDLRVDPPTAVELPRTPLPRSASNPSP